ncbi:uncharacterized protein Z519_02952 [Cladophialophora bantiana CBS 173.52]|uniref:Ketoreductase domain-containing protein n=1 Tax=Cladophialophora bantiana (strain ATCC 10958 / CBS 173.52 / CDC B-1940 / NIH 8579) TaxID=1442370 RepID=A0A0D2GBF0_CLAB1|nr:uncharacterized protein Z519_02952 [Cladophialophora bantiana CBS 173.52]KIW95887.1 hypothetical protein Z519_02952 [Cladophialophora bantiana CBS 173.52]
MPAVSYNQKVVIITDATTPFGQECAAMFAARGANLVLNFPPSSLPASPASPLQSPRDRDNRSMIETHQELKESQRIVAAAVGKYGTVHILINNASFRSPGPAYDLQSSTAWESMRRVVIDGAFKCAKAVWPHFRKNGYGRISFIDSEPIGCGVAELASRFALFGLAETLVREGVKYNIRVNVIAPQCKEYLSCIDHVCQHLSSSLNPAVQGITSLAVALSHESNKDEAGSLFAVGDDHITKFQWERSKGVFLNPDINFTSAALAIKWGEIYDFSEKTYSTSAMDFGSLLPQMQELPGNAELPASDFSGRVVLVTGGGSGLGRAYSIAFAKLRASVVVNDLADPQAVVDEIRSDGGIAAPVISSVEEGDCIVQKALELYGHIDILVNNAGFVCDKSFVNMDENIWNSVMDVHLNGTYQMTKAAWPHFVRQRHGCIINTTSTSGIYGNFGQANYSAAKLGILGVSEATAREGQKYNIRVNTIAPVASTRSLAMALTDTDKNNLTVFLPEYVAPVVVLLSSDTLNGKINETTGGLFEVGCGWHANTRLRPVSELKFSSTAELSPDALSMPWLENTELQKANGSAKSPINTNKDVLEAIAALKRVDVEHNEYKFTERDVALYNLSVGAKRLELCFLWEESTSFQPIPTFGVIPFFSMETIYYHGQFLPRFMPTQSLLGEVYLEILQDTIPSSGHLQTRRRLVEVLDKKSAAVAITGYTTVDATTGIPLFYNELSFFMRGAGGFGGVRDRPHQTPSSRTYIMPTRQPDAVDEFRTSEEQAALYRLTGDRMAMHIDPEFSKKGGFPLPILHGMCFMGIAGKHLFQRYGSYRSIKVKLVGTVVPGQTLRTEMWESENEKELVVFQMRVVETGKLCIAGGGIWLRNPLGHLKTSML